MKTSKYLFIVFIVFFSFQSSISAQTNISYTGGTIQKIGVTQNINSRFWAGFNLYTFTYWDDLTPELSIHYNYIKKDHYFAYIGIGGSFNGTNSIFFPFGIEFQPIPSADRFHLYFEFTPTYDIDDYPFYAGYGGIRYRLSK